MHPFLARPQWLAVYLLCWAPVAALLAYIIRKPTGAGLLPTALVVGPLCFVYAFICLSTWYSCRFMPLERSGLFKLLIAHGAASLAAGALWTLAGNTLGAAVFRATGQSQDFEARVARHAGPVLFGSGVLLYLLAVAFHYVLIATEASREARRREEEARVLAAQAELRALKAQINPHFLFNSLNSISALASVNAAGAREMCGLLADFLRRTLGLGDRHAIPLGDELALARCFLAIEQVRFGPRLKYEEQVADGAEACLAPPLLLQPLIENAVTHGIANLPEGGVIRLAARCADGLLSLTVENAFDPEFAPARRSGLGIANVRKRLEARYGDRAFLRIRTEGDQFRVTVTIPVEAAS